MSWKKHTQVVRRLEFVKSVLKYQESMSRLCGKYGMSRKSGYKWKGRFEEGGVNGLRDRTCRPHDSPRRTGEHWLKRIRGLRRRHRSWGSGKLWARLRKEYPRQKVPSARTIGQWLQRMKLSRRGRRRTRQGPQLTPKGLTQGCRSNQVWTVDFKGWFRTRDGGRVEPLTVRDMFSRYVLTIRLLPDQKLGAVRREFGKLFGAKGYPRVIRVDNGSPFASTGAAGLSQLSAWWTALGIRVEFIAPGHPEQNGAHEQMHRVLKAETTRPTSSHRAAQQRRTNRWIQVYNTLRPHEGLGQRVPAEVYHPRPEPRRRLRWSYPSRWTVRQVRSNGQIKWEGRKRFIGEAFVGYPVGLQPAKAVKGEKCRVYFGRMLIGELWTSDVGGMRPTRCVRRP